MSKRRSPAPAAPRAPITHAANYNGLWARCGQRMHRGDTLTIRADEITCPDCREAEPSERAGRDSSGRFVSTVPAMTRFLKRLAFDPGTGCVVWTGGTTSGRGHTAPYGSFWDQGRRWFAHRWAAKYIHGLDIDGFQVDHCCPNTGGLPNTLCVEHLQAVTFYEHVELTQRRKFIYVQVGLEQPDPVWEADDTLPAIFSPPSWLSEIPRF